MDVLLVLQDRFEDVTVRYTSSAHVSQFIKKETTVHFFRFRSLISAVHLPSGSVGDERKNIGKAEAAFMDNTSILKTNLCFSTGRYWMSFPLV